MAGGTSAAARSATTRVAAVAQLRSTSDKRRNLSDVAACAGLAKRAGAAMLFLPECFGFLGEDAGRTLRAAEPAPLREGKERGTATTQFREALAGIISSHARPADDEGGARRDRDGGGVGRGDKLTPPLEGAGDEEGVGADVSVVDELRFIAKESGLWISGGGVHTKVAGDETKVHNTHVIVDSDGRVRACYHKIHLFDVSLPDRGVELRESRTTSPGSGLVVCDSPLGRLGLSICYDLRFPELYVDLVRNGGAEVLLVPSAFTVPTGKAHWHALLRARAIESQCYVLAAAQFGRHNARRESYGHSLGYDPWGELIADAGGCDGPGMGGGVRSDGVGGGEGDSEEEKSPAVRVPSIVTCDVDLGRVASVRERMPVLKHRSDAGWSSTEISRY